MQPFEFCRNALLAGAVLIALTSCGPRPETGQTTPGILATPQVQAVPGFDATAVRLDAAESARLAQEGRAAVSAQVQEGLELNLWAAEPMLGDPVAIALDSLGRLFVTVTTRTNRAEIDIRGHRDWMVPSMQFQHVEDKRNFYMRELAPERSSFNQWLTDFNQDGSRDWRDLTVHKERVFRIEDTNRDGRADYSQLIVEGFNDVISDVAHGVLPHNDDLFLTLSPDIWRLRDTTGDGIIDSKESLAHGFGVHIGFGGHGLSGPVIGPDGRLYWKMGDLGFNVTTFDGRRVAAPHEGTIVRANPDGTEFEIFASGLRNPQEFAFDEYGNLITVDNDGDHPGEQERVVYVTDGSDAGWRISWQFGKYVDPDNNAYKVWMDEGLHLPRFEGQAAFIVPPIAAYHAGPSGMAYNPGTALGDAWRKYFFVTIFTGSPAASRINAFRLRESGAGFELDDDRELLRGVLANSLAFGPDGALYLADWVEGWSPNGRGRIWTLDVPGGAASAARAETRNLIAQPFSAFTTAQLVDLLRHDDMRIRTKAQFGLVDRGAANELLASARQTDHQLARVHALWGIGQLARRTPAQARVLAAFLRDSDPEIRAQAAKVIGDVRFAGAASALMPLLGDPAARPRFFAAEALGRIGHRPAVNGIVQMLAANDDQDVYLRHAGALALARIGDPAPVVALADHPSRGVRVAAVVALRRMGDPGVARFLRDREEYVATEAARAINDDESIEAAIPALAMALEDARFTNPAFVRRAINANMRVGTEAAARRVAAYAARAAGPDTLRAEAIATLGVWPSPSVLDRVDGMPRQIAERDTAISRAALAEIIEPLLTTGSPLVQVAALEAAGRLRMQNVAPLLLARVTAGQSPEVRIAAVNALHALGENSAAEAVRLALQDAEPTVRMAALGLVPTLGLTDAATAELLGSVMGRGTIIEQQAALASIGRLPGVAGAGVLSPLVDQLLQGQIPRELRLDLTEAARATGDPALTARLDELEEGFRGGPPVSAFADALYGGSVQAGQRIVMQHPGAQCTRCHTLTGTGAAITAGPDLRGVGSRLSREQLLESLVDPDARIAPGFGAVVLQMRDGSIVAGTLMEETPTHLTVRTADGTDTQAARANITQRTNAPSAMPAMHTVLTRRELRDVVEYLSTLR
jgi:quinoprotein glucose dehydrogenase